MTKLVKKLFHIISLGSLTLTSCIHQEMYGVPVDINMYKAVRTQTENNLPIKGLSVKLIQSQDTIKTEFTNPEGIATFNFEFYNDETYSVLVEDIDGEENLGNFKSQEASLNETDTTNITMIPSDKL